MPVSIGDKLGPYEILASIGKGGMGEVYRARDPRLNRDVDERAPFARWSSGGAAEEGVFCHPTKTSLAGGVRPSRNDLWYRG
jgi:serine/threonine protein kinase